MQAFEYPGQSYVGPDFTRENIQAQRLVHVAPSSIHGAGRGRLKYLTLAGENHGTRPIPLNVTPR